MAYLMIFMVFFSGNALALPQNRAKNSILSNEVTAQSTCQDWCWARSGSGLLTRSRSEETGGTNIARRPD